MTIENAVGDFVSRNKDKYPYVSAQEHMKGVVVDTLFRARDAGENITIQEAVAHFNRKEKEKFQALKKLENENPNMLKDEDGNETPTDPKDELKAGGADLDEIKNPEKSDLSLSEADTKELDKDIKIEESKSILDDEKKTHEKLAKDDDSEMDKLIDKFGDFKPEA